MARAADAVAKVAPAGLAWNPVQAEALVAAESFLLLGPAGSGKTQVLLEKAHRLASAGQRVAWASFAYRALEFIKDQAQARYAPLVAAGTLQVDVLHELAARQLRQHGLDLTYASNNQVRHLLRGLLATQGFTGSLTEAEQLIRAAKGRAKKLPESDRFYPLVKAYQARLDELGLSDRHDLVRRHVLGMKDGSVPPLPVDWLVLDGVQDATELQLIWLQLHLTQGVRLAVAGDDDVTTFGREGAMGPAALTQIKGWTAYAELEVLELPHHYRVPAPLLAALDKQARQLRVHLAKPATAAGAAASPPKAAAAPLVARSFPNLPALHTGVADLCRVALANHERIGLITRSDFAAATLAHVLRKGAGGAPLHPASFARLIWEEPTPQVVLASLHVLLGQATPAQLTLLLLGLGVPVSTVAEWQAAGELNGPDWLARGAPLALTSVSSPTVAGLVQQVRRALRQAHTLWQARNLPPPRIFKALWADLLPLIPTAEHPQALLALDMLLSLSGKLSDVLPRVLEETLPAMHGPITVAPVREVRHHEFDRVVLINVTEGIWPPAPEATLGADHDHERRLWLLACSRAARQVVLTHVGEPAPLATELGRHLGVPLR